MVQRLTPVTQLLRRLRQENHKFKAKLAKSHQRVKRAEDAAQPSMGPVFSTKKQNKEAKKDRIIFHKGKI